MIGITIYFGVRIIDKLTASTIRATDCTISAMVIIVFIIVSPPFGVSFLSFITIIYTCWRSSFHFYGKTIIPCLKATMQECVVSKV
mgnify:CR=1 FL=1